MRQNSANPFLACEGAAELVLFESELAKDIFDNNDGAIDDEAEVHGAETHEISRQAERAHHGHGE